MRVLSGVPALICVLTLGFTGVKEAAAAEGYATVTRTSIVNAGGWRDGYFLFDYVVEYRWPKRTSWANFAPTTGRARAALAELRVSRGYSVRSDANYYYCRVQAGFRARVLNPLSYGFKPFAYTSELGAFSSELKIRWRT